MPMDYELRIAVCDDMQKDRAYIVNIAQTKRIHPYEFDMKSETVIPISRHRYNDVNRQFVDYLTN